MNEEERKIGIANTMEFIKADSITVVFKTTAKERVKGGGNKVVSTGTAEPQIMRLIPQTDVMPQVQTPDGVQLTPTFVLMAAPDAEMERWWRFDHMGQEMMVVSPPRPLHTGMAIWRKADVALYEASKGR